MAQFFEVHPENPQPRSIRAAVDIMKAGGVIAYPTDSCYALGCRIGDKAAMERIRPIPNVDEPQPPTPMSPGPAPRGPSPHPRARDLEVEAGAGAGGQSDGEGGCRA